MLVCPKSVIQCMLYIFLNAYVLPYIFFSPNHALNWECSKDEQSFIWKLFSNEKGGDLFSWGIIFLISCDFPYILYWNFLLMTKGGRSNGRLLTWEDISNIFLAILFILMLCALLVIFVCIIFNNNVLPNCSLCYLCLIISFWAFLIYSLKFLNLNIF